LSPERRPTVSAEEVYRAAHPEFGAVPALRAFETCEECLGPVAAYTRCPSCRRLFSDAPAQLEGMVVPMSTARNPSPWYSKLVAYKNFDPAAQMPIAALVHLFTLHHARPITELLGGEADVVAIVPSTRGKSFQQQPLRETLARSPHLREKLQGVVSHRPGITVPRRTYTPEAFACTESIQGTRVLLVEDLWVSGSKAISTAGAMLEAGAASVLIVPVARLVEAPGFYPAEHPYYAAMAAPHDYTRWPR